MSKFQQRHFEAFAQLMQDNVPTSGSNAQTRAKYREQLIRAMCELFKQDNPRFNPDRFRLACVPGNYVRSRRLALPPRRM